MSECEKLINRSVSHSEIVSAPWDADLAAELSARCADRVEANDGVTEYWGGDGPDAWRVHLIAEDRDSGGAL